MALSIPEKFYLDNNFETSTIEELAKNLQKTIPEIEFEIELAKQRRVIEAAKEKLPVVPEPPPPPETPLLKSFARRKEGGVAIMTPAASQMGDELEKERAKNKPKRDCVQKVRK